MAQQTTKFATSGMHCGSCAMLIDMTVGDLDGVTSSKTDLASGETTVTYDDASLSADDIAAAIRGAGYEAEPAA
jgi:copper chaperone CopZ